MTIRFTAARVARACLLGMALSATWLVPGPLVASSGQALTPAALELTPTQLETAAGAALASETKAFTQTLESDPATAAMHAEAAAKLAAEQFGRVAPEYGTALANQGLAEQAAGRFDRAVLAYQESIEVIRANQGENSVGQVAVANALAETLMARGDRRDAAKLQERTFLLQKAFYGPDSPQLLDALYTRARWAERTSMAESAARAYQRIVNIISKHYGAYEADLIDPLMAFAFVSLDRETGKFARTPRSIQMEADRAAARAVRIARRTADTDPALLARTLVRQGDWMQYIGLRRRGQQAYREAWAMLTENPNLSELRAELFATPTSIYEAPLRPVYNASREGTFDERDFPREGFVEVSYDINPRGRPVNIRILDGYPAGLLDAHVVRQIRGSLYRPEYRDGKPIRQHGLTLRHEFSYDDTRFSDSERAFIERIASERVGKSDADESGYNGG
ncbi:MAG: tetratricopeptide repeat protein [Pseudomonadota bacterium]